MLWLLASLALAGAPSDHTLVYYNARMALRDGQALEAVKLWLLRNALEDETGAVSPYDADFHSVTWAALGALGVCPDGHPNDDDGAGLWPLALHNWVVRNMGRRMKPTRPRPFDAFDVGRQQRFVAIGDVLGAQELRSVRLFRGRCTRPRLALLSAGQSVTADLSDRQVSAILLRHLLERARDTLVEERVRGQAAIEARLFDIDLKLTALAEREARQRAREQARKGRQTGLSRESVVAMREDAPAYTLAPDSEAARILRASVGWPVSEWMTLSNDRRLFLFDHARAFGGDPSALDRTALGVVDELTARGEGEEVERWIARYTGARAAVWSGDRGQRLLALDRETGFRERSVLTLHQGVDHLERGDLPGALRAMAYALQRADESRAAGSVQSLSRRWLSFVAAQFEITDDLLATLQELLPRRDYAIILEDLMWRAALHADHPSFERGLAHQVGRGALERRVDLLEPLARGDSGRFVGLVAHGLTESPSETLRFCDQLVQRLEREGAQVRAGHLPMLARLRRLLVAPMEEGSGRRGRTAGELVERLQAIAEGLGALDADATARDRARSLAPGTEVFAGSVRLAPADPLPWPFTAVEAPAPSVFLPLELVPEEWKLGPDERVFGWRIGG